MRYLTKFNESKKKKTIFPKLHKLSETDFEDYLLEMIDIGYEIQFYKEYYLNENEEEIIDNDFLPDDFKMDEEIKFLMYEFQLYKDEDDNENSRGISFNEIKSQFRETKKHFEIIENCLKRLNSMVGEIKINVTEFTISGLGQFSVEIKLEV